MKKLITYIFFFCAISFYSQENTISKKYIKTIINSYKSTLNLDRNQQKKIKKILKKYNNKLYEILKQSDSLSRSDKNKFNRDVKIQNKEIFDILTPVQFENYLKIRKKVEPYKNYKI